MRSLVRYRNIFIAVLLAVLSAAAWAAEPQLSAAADADNWRNFENLVNTISTAQQELTALRKQLQRAADDSERERLRAEVNRKAADIDSLQTAWEMWATGGVDMQMFAPKSEEKFDWRSELQSVFEPIVAELRRLTERPRKIERLRSEQLFFEQRLAADEAAVQPVCGARSAAAAVHRPRQSSRLPCHRRAAGAVRGNVGAVRARRLDIAGLAADHAGGRRPHLAALAARLSQGGKNAAQHRPGARGRAGNLPRPAVEGAKP